MNFDAYQLECIWYACYAYGMHLVRICYAKILIWYAHDYQILIWYAHDYQIMVRMVRILNVLVSIILMNTVFTQSTHFIRFSTHICSNSSIVAYHYELHFTELKLI